MKNYFINKIWSNKKYRFFRIFKKHGGWQVIMRKVTNNYYLSVEGETEKWYFNHLQNLINNSDKASHKVIFNIKISKSITKIC